MESTELVEWCKLSRKKKAIIELMSEMAKQGKGKRAIDRMLLKKFNVIIK